jgi:putative acetyltransferase
VIDVRPQRRPDDLEAIRLVNRAAFDGERETSAFDEFRANRDDIISLVATDAETVVGHVLFSPVTLKRANRMVPGMGLGQLAVLPGYQRQGIGSRLAEIGLEKLRAADCPFVIVVGHAGYYPRFGFEIASRHGIECQWKGIPDENFMVVFLDADRQPELTGKAYFEGL